MEIGIIVPQGWTGEYRGWSADRAWTRTREVAQQAERLGFESIWLFDHFHTTPEPTDELTFESFTTLTALAALTSRVRLGHIVLCAGYRPPSLVAKMASTLDVITGGRFELGLGAGWKQEEWEAYGYHFPPTRERLARLKDTLEIVSRMFADGRASYHGEHASVEGAINLPKGIQRPIPIMVGGNGPEVTWRLAARYAQELNLDGMPPDEVAEATTVIRQRCEEIGRDPASLRLSAHIWWERLGQGRSRVALLSAYREAGMSRVMSLVREAVDSDEALEALAGDALEAGATLAPSPAVPA